MPRPEGPLDPDAGVVERLAWELRRLREAAGSPSYSELARRAHYSRSTLARAAAGRELPSLPVVLAYVRACGGDAQPWEVRWREVAAEVAPAALVADEELDAPAPYVGLAPFAPGDADRFFGRERLVADLVGELRERRFLAVFGASGAGKSSLLRAGLIPAVGLKSELITPGAEPESRLRRALADGPGLLVVDQFEELFTLCPDHAVRQRFITALLDAARDIPVVIGVRADFYGHCAGHRELVEALQGAQVLLPPMSTDELRAAITLPANRFGYTVEGALVSRLIGEATGRPGVLPLLSHALLETWRRRRGNALTLAGYEAAGGVQRAVARSAEQAYAALTEEQRQRARQIFGRLTTSGEGAEDTMRRISRTELDYSDPVTFAVVDSLARARLLTVDAESVQLAHEALIRCWPRLRDWLNEDRDRLRIHRRLTEAACTWEALDRDPEALYRGAPLALAQGVEGTNALEQEFLRASEHAARRRVRRQRQLVAALAVLLVLALAASGLAWSQRQTAVEQRRIALVGKLVAQSAALASGRPDAAVRLTVEAFRQGPDLVEARGALLSSQSQYFEARLSGHTAWVVQPAFSRDGRVLATASHDTTAQLWDVENHTHITTLAGHTGAVSSVAFSPDGRVLATASHDTTVRLWDVAGHSQIATLSGHTALIRRVVFSPDGRLLATVGDDRTARLWDAATHAEIATLAGHTDVVGRVAFSSDSGTLATASSDGTVRLWDVATHAETAILTGEADIITGVAFAPGGNVLAASDDKSVRLWNVDSRTQFAVLPGNTTTVTDLAFSPDGGILATSSTDKTARLWDVATRTQVATLTGHTNSVFGLAFGPDGRLATAGDDTAVLWTLRGRILHSFPASPVKQVTFSPDGQVLAAASADGAVRLWNVADRTPIAALTGHTGVVLGVAFSPDGRLLATTGDDKTMRLWDITGRAPVGTITGDSISFAVAFSQDSRILATAGIDHTARLWDIGSRTQLATLAGHTGIVFGAAFSPDGRTLATASHDKTIRLWDVANRTHVATLTGHTGTVFSLAFSRDGKYLASAGNDATARLWHVAGRTEIAALTGHSATVSGVAFSPDGHTLVTSSNDATARLWDVETRTHIATLAGHTNSIGGTAFSPDGHTVATASDDSTVRLWDPDPTRVIADSCRRAGAITRARWEQLVPELPHRAGCS